jgi:hypothetical protein
MVSTRIYWRWTGNCKYEFYIDTGRKHNLSLLETSLMITINIVGGGKVSNKRGRLKKRLMSPPPDFVIRTGETWCWLNDNEKKHYLDLTKEELKEVLILYELNLRWLWIEK